MKEQKENYWKRMLALLALLGFLSVTGTALAYDGEGIWITPEVTAGWWQWAFSIPSSVHPLTDKAIRDPSGAKYCMVGQQGNEWFLGGSFKEVDITPGSAQTQSNENGIEPVVIVRECEIPLGKTILIPVLSGECSTAEEVELGNIPNNLDLLAKIRYLRYCAKTLADAIDKNTVAAYFGPVFQGNWIKHPVEVKRVHTVFPFSVTFSQDNVLSSNCGPNSIGKPFLCEPNPNPSFAHADGYWAQVRPLKPGTYKLQTFGEAPEFDFALRITYTLTVVGPKDQ
jgi:hypothetical protein